MTQDSSTYWKKARTEVRAAGFDPDRAAETNAVVTIASAYTNAHRCNNRVKQITELLVDLIADRCGAADAAGPHQRLRPGALSRHQLAGQRVVRAVGEQGQQPYHHGLRRGPR